MIAYSDLHLPLKSVLLRYLKSVQLNIPAFNIYHLTEPQIKSSHIMKQLHDMCK